MKNEIKKSNQQNGEGTIYYETLDINFPEDKLGNPVMYFPSNDNILVSEEKINPFVNIIRENFAFHNVFRIYSLDTKFSVIHDLIITCSEYMANSIMLNFVSLMEDPHNATGLINSIRPFINSDSRYGQNFFAAYDTYMNICRSGIGTKIRTKLQQYFIDNQTNDIIKATDRYVPFMADIVDFVTNVYVFEGQRFISTVITNGGLDIKALNKGLIKAINECAEVKLDQDEIYAMSGDAAYTISYFNAGLDIVARKLGEITEAIVYSGMYHFRQMANEINWEQFKDDKKQLQYRHEYD